MERAGGASKSASSIKLRPVLLYDSDVQDLLQKRVVQPTQAASAALSRLSPRVRVFRR